jgi:hypothetical protein
VSSAGDRHVDQYAERKRRNVESRKWAHRDGEPWTEVEEELLLTDWVLLDPAQRDERLVSQVLERTIEACRVRCEHIRARLGITVRTTVTTTKTTTAYIGLGDDPADQWWSPDYYK